MNSVASEFDPFDEVAESFVERYRRGERPSLEEYIDRYPELAQRIRALFPALALVEQVGSLGGGRAAGPREMAPGKGEHPEALGEYRILREVGRGGMGIVYEAVQESLGRHVALKVLPFNAALTPTHLERFRREAQAAAQLHHTNIVPVFGVGEDAGLHYYAMQFIQGQGLDSVLRELRLLRRSKGRAPVTNEPLRDSALARSVARGLLTGPSPAATVGSETAVPPMPSNGRRPRAESCPPTAGSSGGGLVVAGDNAELTAQSETQYFRSVARVGVQVADALAYAHQQGIIHRDIKPANLLLDAHGTVWVTDFGLAKAVDANELTGPGDIVGTLRYMAPERFLGVTDLRGDVYGLGASLYELVTLQPPFDDTDRLSLIKRVSHEEPAAPRKLDDRIPHDLETIILKAMDKDPQRRFQSASEMADELRLFLADRTLRIRRSSWRERSWRWYRRNKLVACLTAFAALLLIAVTVVSSVSAVLLFQEEQATRHQLDLTEEAEKNGQKRLFESLLAEARASHLTRRPGQRVNGLRAIKEALKLPLPPGHTLDELRNEAIACLLLPDLELAKEWNSWPFNSHNCTVALDAAFERYALVVEDGTTTIRRVSDDHLLLTLPGAGPIINYARLCFSPDGRYLAQCYEAPDGWHGRLWKLDGPEPIKLVDEDNTTGFAFSPDGRECAVFYRDRWLRVYETASGKERRRWGIDCPSDFAHLSWNPHRPQVLIFWQDVVWIVSVETGQVEWKVPNADRVGWADWHPEGRLLAVGSNADLKIRLWDTDSRQMVLPPLEGHQIDGIVLRFSPDGESLVSGDWWSLWRLWNVRSGQQQLAVPGAGRVPDFNATATLVGPVINLPQWRLYRYWSAPGFRSLLPHRSADRQAAVWSHSHAAIDPMGRVLAVRVHSGIALVDLVRGEEAALLPGDHNPLAFEPSGALLTQGPAGLLRWPVRSQPATGQWHYGPPRVIAPIRRWNWDAHGSSADCQVLAIPDKDKGAIVVHRKTHQVVHTGEQRDVRYCAVSPDGEWVATGSHWLDDKAGAKVWHARTGEPAADLPVGSGRVGFSPKNGKWLATGNGGVRLWEVGTWRPGPVVGSPVSSVFAFDPTGRLLAVNDDPGIVRLVIAESGKELLRLTAPVEGKLEPCCFTPDGCKLITFGHDRLVHIFDLAAIRRDLRPMGLDWEEEAPPPPQAPGPVPPLTITVDTGSIGKSPAEKRKIWQQETALCSLLLGLNPFNFEAALRRGDAHFGLGEFPKALDDYYWALVVGPPANNDLLDPEQFNHLAWHFATRPGRPDQPAALLLVAQKAVELAPEVAHYRNTLGVVYYRVDRYHEATLQLERSLRDNKDETAAFDLYFLAMCHHRLGHAARARECYGDAVRWTESRQGKLSSTWAEELKSFRAEAEAVLGIQSPVP
jgi:serine/threonine protein kinase/WD40 repeat protein